MSTLPLPLAGQAKRGAQGRLGYLLHQARATMQRAFDQALAEIGLTLPQFTALSIIASYDRPSAADVARLAMRSAQTVNLVIRALERRGLVQRAADPTHGRILRLSLTDDGQDALNQARRITRGIEREMVEELSDADEAVIRNWLVSLATRFGAD